MYTESRIKIVCWSRASREREDTQDCNTPDVNSTDNLMVLIWKDLIGRLTVWGLSFLVFLIWLLHLLAQSRNKTMCLWLSYFSLGLKEVLIPRSTLVTIVPPYYLSFPGAILIIIRETFWKDTVLLNLLCWNFTLLKLEYSFEIKCLNKWKEYL